MKSRVVNRKSTSLDAPGASCKTRENPLSDFAASPELLRWALLCASINSTTTSLVTGPGDSSGCCSVKLYNFHCAIAANGSARYNTGHSAGHTLSAYA